MLLAAHTQALHLDVLVQKQTGYKESIGANAIKNHTTPLEDYLQW